MKSAASTSDDLSTPPASRRLSRSSAASVFWAEGLASVAANLLMSGIFFYTAQQLHWGLARNLMLASGQGAVYVAGALVAGKVSKRCGTRPTLIGVETILAITAAVGWFLPTPAVLITLLLVYSGLIAVQWPILESLAATGVNGIALSRRLTHSTLSGQARVPSHSR